MNCAFTFLQALLEHAIRLCLPRHPLRQRPIPFQSALTSSLGITLPFTTSLCSSPHQSTLKHPRGSQDVSPKVRSSPTRFPGFLAPKACRQAPRTSKGFPQGMSLESTWTLIVLHSSIFPSRKFFRPSWDSRNSGGCWPNPSRRAECSLEGMRGRNEVPNERWRKLDS